MVDRVLITGARAAVALDIARDFRAAGWEPHLADCSPARVSRWSSAVAGFHRYPAPVTDGEGFRRRIANLADALGVRLIVPACEEVFHLAAPSLAPSLAGRLFAPPLDQLRLLHDKLQFARACEEWQLPVPESRGIDTRNDLMRFVGDTRNWVFKPRFSRFGTSALVGPSDAALATVAVDRGWLAQRRIHGVEASFYAVAHNGRLAAFSSYRSDWRMRGGASYAFEPLPARWTDGLRDMAATVARMAGLSGQFACDAMIDATDKPWLIECNPRATSGAHLLIGDGRLARAMTNATAPFAETKAGTAYLAPALWLIGLPHAIRAGRFRSWWHTRSAGRDVLAQRGDRLPLLGALVDTLGFSFAGQRHGTTPTAATTRDIEWNGEDLP